MKHEPQRWNQEFASQSSFLKLFTEVFTNALKQGCTLDSARDAIRSELHSKDDTSFPLNSNEGTDIFALCREILQEELNCY